MSDDYDIACTACRTKVSMVASSSIAYGDKLWRDPAALDRLATFLFAHQGHPLVFENAEGLEAFEEREEAGSP